MAVILVGGGSRSGKSAFAQAEALRRAGTARPVYVATAMVEDDAEMAERVQRHRDDRGHDFDTIEAPHDLCAALAQVDDASPVLVDCLTIWCSNLLARDERPDVQALLAAARARSGDTILVTNEVGEGIVPMHPVARRFRDESGFMNQAVAAGADEVVYLRFGIPQRIK